MDLIDLHTHSTASDGTLTPRELVAEAKRSGLTAVALTDHDTVQGLAEAVETGRELGIEVVPGCELSVEGDRPMHILGLFLPPKPDGLETALRYLRDKRHERNRQIVARLNELGLSMTYEEVRAVSGDGSVGRPHVARVMLDKGYVSSIQQAFNAYLGSHGRAYVPKVKLLPEEAIPLLKAEGATVVLAHPYFLGLTGAQLEYMMRDLVALGLDGIEAYYSEHSFQQTQNFLRLARRLGLAVSGGTDFHGANKPNIHLGLGRGHLRIPASVLHDLKAYRAARGLG